MSRKKFPDLTEDFAERTPDSSAVETATSMPIATSASHVLPENIYTEHKEVHEQELQTEYFKNNSTYISRAAVNQVEKLRQDKKVENRNLELGMSQGRKGLKLKRMTMAFSDINYDFMRTYARQKGITATQLVNDLLSELRKAVYKY